MQEPKKVQFNLRNSTTSEVSIDLFNASSITPITNETQFEAGAVNSLSSFTNPTNGFYNPLTNETILCNDADGIAVVNQENSTTSIFLNEQVGDNDIIAIALNTTNNNLYLGNNKTNGTETNVLVIDAITYTQIDEITIPNPNLDLQIRDINYNPNNNYVYVAVYDGITTISSIIYIDCSTNLYVGSIVLSSPSQVQNITYCATANSIYVTNVNSDEINIINCVTNTLTGTIYSVVSDVIYSKLLYNSLNNCMYFIANDGSDYIRVLNCNSNTIISTTQINLTNGGNLNYKYNLTLNSALNIIYFQDFDVTDYCVSIFDCATNTVTTTNLINLSQQQDNIFNYNPYFETLNIGSTTNSLTVINTTTLSTITFGNAVNSLRSIAYNPLDGYYYLAGSVDAGETIVRYKDGIVYAGANAGVNNLFFPKFLPNKNSFIYLCSDQLYSVFNTETMSFLGQATTYTPTFDIYEIGNMYDFNYVNSSVYTYSSSLTNLISWINQNALYPSSLETEFNISNTGELNNVGINMSRPISDVYALSSINYLNPIRYEFSGGNTIVFSSYDPILNSLHFKNYSLCKFNLTENNWGNLVQSVDVDSAMCLNTNDGTLYVSILTSNTSTSNQLAVLNSETYELIELVNTQNPISTYLSYDSVNNLVYSSYNSTISVVDCNTNTEITTINLITLTGNATCLCFQVVYVESNSSLYVNCGNETIGFEGLVVIDANDYSLITTIAEIGISDLSYSCAYSPIQNKIYKPLSIGFDVDIIDCTDNSVTTITLTTTDPYNPVYNYTDDKVYFLHETEKTITILDCATETTSEIVEQIAGSINNSFVQGTGFDFDVIAIETLSNGQLLVGGQFTSYNGTPANYVARLNTDGSQDLSFIDIGLNDSVWEISIQSDGKILLGGNFTSYNFGANPSSEIIRLNSDGSVDTSFNVGTGFIGGTVRIITIQSDGKILVGGGFTSYNGTPANRIIRLNSDGSIDGSFVYGTGFNTFVADIVVQSDGKIIVGGGFTDYDGTYFDQIIRLNSDGSIDNSFSSPTSGADVNVVILQPDGKIIIAGWISGGILRLNSDGSIDTSFITGTGFDSLVVDAKLQSDGKIIVGGGFTDYDGIVSNYVAVLNANGSYDSNYDFTSGADATVYAVSIINNDVFYIGGTFTNYDSTVVGYIASVYTTSYYTTPQGYPQSMVYNGNNNSIVLFNDENSQTLTPYSYVYSFDCDTLQETIINKSLPYNNPYTFNTSTYSPINNNYYQLVQDSYTNDVSLVVFSAINNLEITRVLLSSNTLTTINYCSYNNSVYIGGVNIVVVFDCNTNTETTTISTITQFTNVDGNIIFNPLDNKLYCRVASNQLIIDVINNTVFSENNSIFQADTNYPKSCVDLLNNRIVYVNKTLGGFIEYFDCNTQTIVETTDILSLYGLYGTDIIYNPTTELIYCVTINSTDQQNKLLIIDPTTYAITENIILNQETSQVYADFVMALNPIDNTIFIASNMFYALQSGFSIFDCNTNEIISTNTFKVGTTDFSVSSLNINISSVFYNSNYSSFVAFHFIYNTQSLGNGIAITSFTKQNSYSNEAFFPIVESGVCNIVKYDCNINRVMETVYTAPAETPYIGKMVYNENNNYLYFVQYQTRLPFIGSKSIGVLDLTNNTLVTTLYPTLITDSTNNNSGTINTLFNTVNQSGNSFNGSVYAITVQSDNKVLVGGSFSTYKGTIPAYNIIRLNSDGSVDTSFVTGTGFDNEVDSIVIQSDGKIIVGGGFADYNGTSANYIIRLNSDGSVDTSFVTGTGFDNDIYSITIQSDGKILVGGQFTNYNGTSANYIIRLNSDGSVDTSFVYGIGLDDRVYSTAIQSDGKILVGGNFTDYNGTSAKHIIRLNSDGSIDTFFVYGTGFDILVFSIAIQSDGKILIGGDFTDYDGTPANRIIRLNSDGSVDTSFVYGTGFIDEVYSTAIQSDGKILVGGFFTDYDGTPANRIIRLNSDGSVDTSFVYGTGFNNSAHCISLYGDSVLVGGDFSSYNGVNSPAIVDIFTINVSASDLIDIELNPFSNVIQIANTYSDGTTESGNIIVIDCNINSIVQYVPLTNGVEFLAYNPSLNTIAYAGVQNGGLNNFYFGSLAGTSNFTIDGGSVNYDFFVQGLNNDPKKIEEIELIMPQRYLANPVNVQYLDASGNSDLKPYLPNTEIDTFQKATNRAMVKFGDEYVMNINTQIVNFILPPLSTTTMIITYTELIKSDMLDVVIYEEERKAKYTINQSLDGKITAKKYWGNKKMPKELSLNSDWLKEMRKRFQKVEVIEYDQPKLAGGTIQTREVYQDLFGFSKQVKAKHIGITKTPKFKKGVKVKLATKKKPIKPVAEDVQVEEVFQDILRVNAHEIPLEKITPMEMPIDKQPIKPKPVEMTMEQVFQEMLSVNAHEIKLNRIKVPKIKGVKPIQVQLEDLSPMDVFNRSFEDYGSGYLVGVKNPCVDEEKKGKSDYGVYYIKPNDKRYTAFRHSGDFPIKIELTTDWFNDLKRKFDDIQVIAIVKKRK